MSEHDDDRAVVDETTMSVRRTIVVAAPAAAVWAVVSGPEHLSPWLGATRLDGEGVGAQGTVTFAGDDPIPIRIEAFDPPHSITFRWCNEGGGGPAEPDLARSTAFTFVLEPAAEGTRLTVVETGFEHTTDPRGELDAHRAGWDAELDELVGILTGPA